MLEMVNALGSLTEFLGFMTFMKHVLIMMLVAKELVAIKENGTVATTGLGQMQKTGASSAGHVGTL